MRQESFPHSPETSPDLSKKEWISEEVIKNLLETHHSVNNAGSKGIILKFSKDEIPANVAESLEDEASEFEGSLTIKALKVYNIADAEREFEALKKARTIVEDSPDQTIARSPRTYGFYNIAINDGFKEFLNQNGAYITENKVGVIIMDYVEGQDLATMLYKEALRRMPPEKKIYPDDHLDSLTFNELHRAVAASLGFSKPGGKSRDEGERIFEDEMVKTDNEEKLFTFLHKNGFVLSPKILEQIKKTVDLYHKNKLYHNDLHERNIILRDGDMENPKAYVIDYGSATTGKAATGTRDSKVMSDMSIVKRLEPLTKTVEQKLSDRAFERQNSWLALSETLARKKTWQKEYSDIIKALKIQDVQYLEGKFAIHSVTDRELDSLLAIFLKAYQNNSVDRTTIKTFLEKKASEEKFTPFVTNRVKEVLEVLE